MDKVSYILALDVGEARVGVAIASEIAKLPSPLAVFDNKPGVFDELEELAGQNDVSTIVVGLPRNMQGDETKQSEVSRGFAQQLKDRLNVPVVFADESLSTKRAEEYDRFGSGRKNSKYLDDIAACFILEEYFGNEK